MKTVHTGSDLANCEFTIIGDNATQNKQRSLYEDFKDASVGAIMSEKSACGWMSSDANSD